MAKQPNAPYVWLTPKILLRPSGTKAKKFTVKATCLGNALCLTHTVFTKGLCTVLSAICPG